MALVLIGSSMLLTSCLFDRGSGETLAIVHGIGTASSTAFDLPDGTIQIDQKGQPGGCVESVTILNSAGQTLATLTRSGPAPDASSTATEDPDWRSAIQVDVVAGTYHAEAKTTAKCAWAIRFTTPE